MYRKVEHNVVCACCGKSFIAHDKRAIYCSRKCKDVGYKRNKGQDSRLEPRKVICAICGKEFETFNPTQKTCTPECSKENKRLYEKNRVRAYCHRYPHTAEEYKQSRKKQAQQRAEIKAIEKAWLKALHTVERECVYCGELFYCYDWESTKTCSDECRRKRENRKLDKRIPPQAIVDTDINIKKLYRRDGGKCYLCGCECSFDDWNTAASGYKYPGDSYPEIEHVVPLSRGGLHAWDNVRLACHKCNHLKGDQLVLIKPMSKAQSYSVKSYGNPPKRTIQMSLAGEVIRVWDSTGQIKRELGFNDKRIQEVCKGRGKTAFGYRWKYA